MIRSCKKVLLMTMVFFLIFPLGSVFANDANGWYHIPVLTDCHYPVKTKTTLSASAQERLIANKLKAIETLNHWSDIDFIAFLGDIIPDGGNETEWNYAKDFFSRLKKPIVAIAGNHEYSYVDNRDAKGKLALASKEQKESKYSKFKDLFNISGDVFQSRIVGRYLLVFLNPDIDTKNLVELNERQLQWFENELSTHPDMPTIVFCHAPLLGTQFNWEENDTNLPKKAVQPAKAISSILNNHKQVFMWVSGHTHTPPTVSSFNHPVNIYQGRVVNIHCPAWEEEPLWLNSLYLFPDKVMIRTFNFNTGNWEEKLDRVVFPNDVPVYHDVAFTDPLRPAM